MISASELPGLVESAVNNDQRAWSRLVDALTPTIKSVARRHRLGGFDQDEVVQRTWIALMHHIGEIREPASLRFWITTTARHEALAILRGSPREVLCGDVIENAETHAPEEAPPVEEAHLEAVRTVARRLPAHQRELVAALTADPPLSYQEVAEKVGIPIGSIGPTRQRCIARMRHDPMIKQLLEDHPHVARPTRPVRPTAELV